MDSIHSSGWERLEVESKGQVFGQHLAVDGALGAIYGHITDPEPPKALVLSFHGWLGSGKTFFSHMIARNLFDGGLRSPHVKAFLGPRHFLLDPILTQQNTVSPFSYILFASVHFNGVELG